MQSANQIIRRTCCWIFIVVYLSVQQGCAWFTSGGIFGDRKPPELGQVGIASPARAPDIGSIGLSRESGMPRSETLGGTAVGGASGVGAGFAVCTPTIILPWVYPLCIATFGVTGLLIGALAGSEVANIKDAETFAAVLPAGIDIQEALRGRVIQIVNTSGDNDVRDLGAQEIAAGQDAGNTGAPGLVPASRTVNHVDYRKYAAQGMDNVIETSVQYVGLQGAGPGQYRLVLQGSSRLVKTGDGNEIMGKTHNYRGPEFRQESDLGQGTGIKLQVLEAGLESIALEIQRTYFPREAK